MRIAAVQMSAEPEITVNVARARRLVERAAAKGARLVVLPELFAHPFFPKGWDPRAHLQAETCDGRVVTGGREAAAAEAVWLVVPFFERDDEQGLLFNSLVLVDPQGDIVGRYRKLHVPSTPTNLERRYFAPGDLGALVHEVEGVEVGFGICYDRHFPELARLCASRGAQVLVYPTSALSTPERRGNGTGCSGWEATFVARAVENACFVVTASRSGTEDGVTYLGRSLAVDPRGALLASLHEEPEGLLHVDIDLGLLDRVRQDWPVLEHVRQDLVDQLERTLPRPGTSGAASEPVERR